jgi:hypothetical protein
MPGKDGEVFPPRCNMENKLDKLETEREFLLEMCPKDKRDTYEEGKEHTLVRIILRNVPAEYDTAVKTVRDMMKLRSSGKMETSWDSRTRKIILESTTTQNGSHLMTN